MSAIGVTEEERTVHAYTVAAGVMSALAGTLEGEHAVAFESWATRLEEAASRAAGAVAR